jgi:hypothetical protein
MAMKRRGRIVGRQHDAVSAETTNTLIIEAIATETRRPIDEVKRVYDDQFARLKSGARITDYLVLFAARQTRAALARHQ